MFRNVYKVESAEILNELDDKRMLLLYCSAWRVVIDDDDNYTKCDAVLAVAQFHHNFPQFCAADNGAQRNYLLLSAAEADRQPSGKVRPACRPASCRVMRAPPESHDVTRQDFAASAVGAVMLCSFQKPATKLRR